VQLVAGAQYWIVAAPSASNTDVVWNQNAFDGTGPGGRFAQNNGSGWVVADAPLDGLAFDVLGTAPEPGTVVLFGISVASLLLVKIMRRSA
jgi:hypothetical protein